MGLATRQQYPARATSDYKRELVNFVQRLDWQFFVTIGVGRCPDDEVVLQRLREIEARLSKRYLLNRYHKLPDEARFYMLVVLEGEKRLGNRHAHILVHVPHPRKGCPSREMLIGTFCWKFVFLWHTLTPHGECKWAPWEPIGGPKMFKFEPANVARQIYTVKWVQSPEAEGARFEFVTPPKANKFKNENLSVRKNRNWQRRRSLSERAKWLKSNSLKAST